MAARLLLCVSADQATTAIWQRGKLSSIRNFANSDDGWIEFATYVRGARGIPVSIIVDSIDEDYRFETLPKASGSERAQMVARKLRQLYRTTPYSAATLQERSTGRRGDDRYLFAALTDSDLLTSWLRVLQQARVPVAGVHLLPMTTLALVEKLKLRQPNILLIAKSSAGLRQTFCKQGRFRISRLTPLRSGSAQADQFFAEEIGNTRMYLDALTITHVDDPVTVVILDQDGSLAGLPAAISRGRPNLKPVLFGPEEIENQIGAPRAELRESADALHLRLLASGPRLTDLAPPVVETGFRIYRIRQLTYATAVAVVIGSVTWAGIDAVRGLRADSSTAELKDQTRRFEAMYREVTAQFPKAPASAEVMRDAVAAADQLRSELKTPHAMFAVIGAALEESPAISLKRLEWRFESRDATAETGRAGVASKPTEEPRQTGLVTGEVTDYDGNYRTAIVDIQEFVRRLAGNDRVAEVKILELPVNVSSDAGLSGNTNVSTSSRGALFRIAVSFAPGT